MIVFQELNFDPVKKNTEKTMSHLCFDEESDYSEENTCKNEVLLHHRKQLNIFTPHLLIYYIQYQNRKSRLVQMPEAATGGVLQKRKRNSCTRGNTCEFCKIYKNTFFTEQLRTTASEMRILQ